MDQEGILIKLFIISLFKIKLSKSDVHKNDENHIYSFFAK